MDPKIRKLAEEIDAQCQNTITRKDIALLPKEADTSHRMALYLEKLGGPTNLVPGSAAKRLYDADTFWMTGLSLARSGAGMDSINLLFRALMTDMRACKHFFIGTSDPNNPISSNSWVAKAVAKAQEQVRLDHCSDIQRAWLTTSLRVKMLFVAAHFYDSIGKQPESIMHINQSLENLSLLNSKWKLSTRPSDTKFLVSWFEDESPFNEDMKARITLYRGSRFTYLAYHTEEKFARNAYYSQALSSLDESLSLSPNNFRAYMSKAAALLAQKDIEKKKESMIYYQKTIDTAPNDDQEKAIATYQILHGGILGLIDEPQPVSTIKVMFKNAVMMEDLSCPLFGEAECEGKRVLEELMKNIDKFPEDACISSKLVPEGQEGEDAAVVVGHDTLHKRSHKCAQCSKEFSELLRCNNCRQSLYCSAKCKEAHFPVHEPSCKPLV